MAKALRQPAASSGIARLFDMEAAARAVATSTDTTDAAAPSSPTLAAPTRSRVARRSSAERPSQSREIVLTPAGAKTFDELVDLYRKATQTRLTASHVARVIMKAIEYSFDQLEREAKRLGPMKLPSNSRSAEDDRERFESKIADAFVAGMRNTAAPAESE